MGFINIIIFVLILSWSWCVIDTPSAVSETTHVQVQKDLKDIISGYIESQLPNVKNISFKRFWTESLNQSQIKASFAYSFEDLSNTVGESKIEIAGFANLRLNIAKNSWDLESLDVASNHVEFKQPIVVAPQVVQ
ncbi:MAG: hypothetical protein HOO06_13015 [Bdellovibrionaceae bacterium]|nr:hypothetical protein [Pseudobdellovibrionaceae bacterium]